MVESFVLLIQIPPFEIIVTKREAAFMMETDKERESPLVRVASRDAAFITESAIVRAKT